MAEKKERLFIAGLGWMGQHIAHDLNNRSYEIAGTTTTEEKAENLQKEGIEASVAELPDDKLPETLNDADVLIFTIPPRSGQENSEAMIKQAIKDAEKNNVQKAIYISSTSVYPDQNTTVTESDAEYIESRHTGVVMKRLEDLWVDSNIDTTILRCGGLFGRDRSPARFLKDKILRDPDRPVNMTHIDDVVEAIQKIIEEDAYNEIFNVVSINNTSREDFYKPFYKELKVEKGVPNKPYKVVSQDKLKDRFRISYTGPATHTYPNKK